MKRRGSNVCRDVTQLTLLASGPAMSAEVQHLKQMVKDNSTILCTDILRREASPLIVCCILHLFCAADGTMPRHCLSFLP